MRICFDFRFSIRHCDFGISAAIFLRGACLNKLWYPFTHRVQTGMTSISGLAVSTLRAAQSSHLHLSSHPASRISTLPVPDALREG